MPSTTDRYKNKELKDIFAIFKVLEDEFHDYLRYGLGYNKEQYIISGVDLIDAIIRVDKRIAYFEYFHNMSINDEKKAGLLAYWIAKLHPVKFIDPKLRNKKPHANVNEKLAANHLVSALVQKGKIKLWDEKEGVKNIGGSRFFNELIYSFRFRNFTIDSMIILADSLNTESFRIEK